MFATTAASPEGIDSGTLLLAQLLVTTLSFITQACYLVGNVGFIEPVAGAPMSYLTRECVQRSCSKV